MVHTLHITDLNLDKVHAARARVADTVRYIGNAIPLCTKKIEASGQPGTFHFLSYDGRTACFDHVYTATYSDSWAAQVEAQRDGFRGALKTNLSAT